MSVDAVDVAAPQERKSDVGCLLSQSAAAAPPVMGAPFSGRKREGARLDAKQTNIAHDHAHHLLHCLRDAELEIDAIRALPAAESEAEGLLLQAAKVCEDMADECSARESNEDEEEYASQCLYEAARRIHAIAHLSAKPAASELKEQK